jgi:hypothetical protein
MVPGLADPKGISFQSYNYPDRYLRHTGFGFVLHPRAGDPTYINDATFYVKDVPSNYVSRDWVATAVGGNWFQDPLAGARLNTIAITDNSYIVGTNVQQQIWQKASPTSSYSQMPGALVQVDAKSSNLIVGVNAGGQVYQWAGSNWIRIGERAKWVSIGGDGTVVCVNSDAGTIWRYLGRVDAWENIPGIATQLSVGNRNTMWCIGGRNDEIFRWTGSNWQNIPGALTRVAVSSKGKVAGVNRQGNLFVYSDSIRDWKRIPGGGINISISETYIAHTNSASMIYYLKL